jgi:2'-5' RNA ligase
VVDWYVMLFPADRTPRRYARLGERWAAAVGGVVNPNPHVTIAYLVGPAEPAAVVGALRQVPASPVMVEAEGVISYSQTPHPVFGYSASLRVVKTPELNRLHVRVMEVVGPLGLASLFVWDDVDPHLQVLGHMPVHPREALPRLAELEPRYAFRAARLVVSRPMVDGTFPVSLSRRLRTPLRDATGRAR